MSRILIVLLFLPACSGSSSSTDTATDTDAVETTDTALDTTDDGPGTCACAPGLHNERIFVLSDEAELWTYDPPTNSFEFVTGPICLGAISPYSMAVDALGLAWILDAYSERIQTIDVNDPGDCTDSGYSSTPQFDLFGMAFTNESATDPCPRLFVHTYSGSGPFREGDDLGTLGTIDPDTLEITAVGPIDFDGGELTGTRDGRLFAFAGVDPAKLVEYDKADASVIELIPLTGMSKTHASAFAFHSGDFYFFTEAQPAGCVPCLESTCPTPYSTCMADPDCTEEFNCALDNHEITDSCGGGMISDLIDCLYGACIDECFLPSHERVSRVTHMDHDEPGRSLTIIHPQGPIRIVGAGTSPCVPEIPF